MPAQKTNKEELIVKAMQLFRKKGYFNTSIKDLAEQCDIPKSHFYYYFKGGKEELMREVLEAVKTYFQQRVFPIAYQEDLSPDEKWAEISEKLQRVFLGQKGGCIMGLTTMETLHTSEKEIFHPIIKQYFDEMIGAIEILHASESDPSKKAHMVVQDIQGGLIMMQVYQDPTFFMAALERGKPGS